MIVLRRQIFLTASLEAEFNSTYLQTNSLDVALYEHATQLYQQQVQGYCASKVGACHSLAKEACRYGNRHLLPVFVLAWAVANAAVLHSIRSSRPVFNKKEDEL